MENTNYALELNSPPQYNARNYEPVKQEMEIQNIPGQQIQSTVVTIMPEGPPVRDHIIWSLFNVLYMNFCCLGLLALVFSVKCVTAEKQMCGALKDRIKSRDRKLLGDKHGASSYGSTARSLNLVTTVLSMLVIGIIIAFGIYYATMLISFKETPIYGYKYGN